VLELAGATFLAAVYADVMARQYPVGEILVTRRSGNPSSWLGFGTWVAYGAGRTLVCADGSVDFLGIDTIGGAKTHTLSAAEMPSHTHSFSGTGTTSTTGAHVHVQNGGAVNPSGVTLFAGVAGAGGANLGNSAATSSTGDHAHTVTISGTTGSAGSGAAHGNLQPFICVNFWLRTA
jgi:microcystin-dependent protein